nr:NADPH:quinone reductase [Gammaproteobacteria bacterium]
GSKVTAFGPGDRVYCGMSLGFNMTGCYAEELIRPAADFRHLPDQASFAAGAALGTPYATAHYALFARGNAQAKDIVFIHGASGAVGTAAIQLARRAGIAVIGSGGTEEGRQLILEQGANHAVDHSSETYLQEVKKYCKSINSSDGPSLILEMLANVNLAADLDLVDRYGRIVVIGNRGEITINPRMMMMKELDVIGIALFNGTRGQMEALNGDLQAGLKDGSLNPVIGREMPLSEAASSHDVVLEPGARGKLVLIP